MKLVEEFLTFWNVRCVLVFNKSISWRFFLSVYQQGFFLNILELLKTFYIPVFYITWLLWLYNSYFVFLSMCIIYYLRNCAAYWPSAALSNERCTSVNNRCIRLKISGYNLDCGWVELGANVMPTRSRWTPNNYITQCHRQVQLVGVSLLQFEAVRTSSQQRAGPSGPWLSSQQNEKEVLLKTEEFGVSMLQSVQSPTHLSHTTLSNLFK